MVVKDKIDFRVQYRVKEGDSPINMTVKTTGLEELHKILCSMDSFRTPLAQWHQVDVHEFFDDGSVADIPQKHLANLFDWQYGFGKKQELSAEEEETKDEPLTKVRAFHIIHSRPNVSTSGWWKELCDVD